MLRQRMSSRRSFRQPIFLSMCSFETARAVCSTNASLCYWYSFIYYQVILIWIFYENGGGEGRSIYHIADRCWIITNINENLTLLLNSFNQICIKCIHSLKRSRNVNLSKLLFLPTRWCAHTFFVFNKDYIPIYHVNHRCPHLIIPEIADPWEQPIWISYGAVTAPLYRTWKVRSWR